MATRTPRWFRQFKGYTAEHMAEHLGIHVSSYSRKERGLVRFSLEEAFALARLYRVPVEAINWFGCDDPATE